MIEETPVTKHVHECVRILNEHNTGQRLVDTTQAREGYEAVFELIDNPWDEGSEEDQDFREGYEMCLLDVVDAIANVWGVKLPELKVKR